MVPGAHCLSSHVSEVGRIFKLLLKWSIRYLLSSRQSNYGMTLQLLSPKFLAHLHPCCSADILRALQTLRSGHRLLMKQTVLHGASTGQRATTIRSLEYLLLGGTR